MKIFLFYCWPSLLLAFLIAMLLFEGNVVAFKPVDGAIGNETPKGFVREEDGYLYLAVFNYTKSNERSEWPLNRLDLDSNKAYTILDILNKNSLTSKSVLKIDLGPEEGRLSKIKI